MFNKISFYSFIEYSTIYINVFFKMTLCVIKLSRIVFVDIFVTVWFLFVLLLLKQTIPTKKKSTKKRKYKNDTKANPTFYLHNKTNQSKDTNIPYNFIKISNVFSMNFLEILDITKSSLLRCPFSYHFFTQVWFIFQV